MIMPFMYYCLIVSFQLFHLASANVAIVLEGLDVATADLTLQTLKSTDPPTKVLLAVSKKDLLDASYAQKVKMAMADGHTIAIRFDPRCSICKISEMGVDKACKCLTKSSSVFMSILGVQPRYVLFPYTTNPNNLKMLNDIAQCADGMQVVQYVFDLESAMRDPYRKCDLDQRETLSQGLVLIYGFHHDGDIPLAEKLCILREMLRYSGYSLVSFNATLVSGGTPAIAMMAASQASMRRLVRRDLKERILSEDYPYLIGEETSEEDDDVKMEKSLAQVMKSSIGKRLIWSPITIILMMIVLAKDLLV